MLKRANAFAAAALILLSCCANKEMTLASRQAELAERVQQYHEMMQWRDYETASLFVVLQNRSLFLSYTKSLGSGYTISDFLVKQIRMSTEGDKATVIVSRSYIRPPQITLQSEEIVQQWVATEEGVWYLSGPPY